MKALLSLWNRFDSWLISLEQDYYHRNDVIMPSDASQTHLNAPISDVKPDPDVLIEWESILGARHNVRVLCDLAGLTLEEKNIITACVKQESNFELRVMHQNIGATGKVVSTDWGIVQINDYWHIGPRKDFPSVEYVLSHPKECVQFMIDAYKHGALKMWVSYSSGAYKQWL